MRKGDIVMLYCDENFLRLILSYTILHMYPLHIKRIYPKCQIIEISQFLSGYIKICTASITTNKTNPC